MKTIFIGALPFRTTEKFVQDLVLPYQPKGPVKIFADWVQAKFEPYALVEVEKPEEAVIGLDGKKYGETHLRVHVWVNNGAS